jgi:hypothetical protein
MIRPKKNFIIFNYFLSVLVTEKQSVMEIREDISNYTYT